MNKQFICVTLLLALYCGFAHAQPPLPDIAIGSCPELQAINSNLSGDYYLANDIDCMGFDFGDGKGFMPIGDGDTPFTGTFDGKGFTISNVFIDRPAMSRVGVFGFAGKTDGTDGADISHVTVSDFDITGQGAVGSLFGAAYYSNFEDVHSSGSVTGVTMIIGGLGGTSRYSTITNASSSGSVIGDQSGSTSMIFYGGLLGSNERSDLSCSSSDADVIGNYRVGGLVGNNSGTITTSFATGAVQGFYRVGGLAGENISGTIADCFATGDVSGFSGSHELGGLVGLQYRDSVYADGSEPVIRNSYATGSVTGGYNMQGILGLRMNGTCSGTYWDVMTSGIMSDGCGSSGLTTSEMRDQSSYVDWDFDTVWTINGDYPKLQCTPASSVEHTVTPSTGTGGSISPDSEQTVNQGSTVSFTVLSDSGYKIDKVEGCGGTLSGNIYTIAPVTADCEVTASFTPHTSRNGMTWGVNRYNLNLDLTFVHCYGQQGPNRGPCNPYQGDTSCSVLLPVLCVKKDGSARPPYEPPPAAGSMNREYYTGWVEGSIALTVPAQGNIFDTLNDVNAYCEAQLGQGYRAAEFHDGRWVYGMDENNFYGNTWPQSTRSGGWGFYAPGQLSNASRFWVDINDQNANCWSRTATTTRSLSVNSSGASGVAITGSSSAYSGTTNYTKTGVPNGTTITLTAPAAGSASTTFSFWSGCDATDVAARTCTVTMSANKAVTANFVLNSYTVTPSAGANGSISPNTPQTVDYGNTTSFTLTPDTGYGIDTVAGCNGSLNGNVYTTGAITGDCAVTASFITAYPVIPKARKHGSISPGIPQQISEGHTTSFTITPDADYSIKNVHGCDGTLTGNMYTTGLITQKCKVRASFKKKPVVTAKARRHGSIAPSGRQTVSEGTILNFTVTADAGYSIRKVRGCGGTLSGNVYTTKPIDRKCKVRATFTKN